MGHGGAEDAQGLAYFAFHRDLGGVGGRGAACVHAALARPAFLGGAALRRRDVSGRFDAVGVDERDLCVNF